MDNKNKSAKRGNTITTSIDWHKLDMNSKVDECLKHMTAYALLGQNHFVPLAMRVGEYDANYVDNQVVDFDTYHKSWALTRGLRILTLEFDKWETHDPNRPRIDLTCIAIEDLVEFRKRFEESQ